MNDFFKEKELLLDSIENNTPEHWKNYYKDVPIECIYDDLVIDINEIKRLQQENQQLKEKINGIMEERDYLFNKLSIENKYLQQENQQLKERIDKAIEYIKELYDNTDDTTCYEIDKNTKKELLKMLGEEDEI